MINRQQSEPKTLTLAKREAQKVFVKREAEKALSEYEAAQKALHANGNVPADVELRGAALLALSR